MSTLNYAHYFRQYQLPSPNSHKGENGKLLVIGGSRLFHASIFWSAWVASRFVDIVHFSSPANENNVLVRQQLKKGFWQGIVVDWQDVDAYIKEDDAILIGPGMERGEVTKTIINNLIKKHPNKNWVIDGGALQEINPLLLSQRHIITPHKKELKTIIAKIKDRVPHQLEDRTKKLNLKLVSKLLDPILKKGTVVLAKGRVDHVLSKSQDSVVVYGGNAGLTKGGSGDVLAGLVAAFYTQVGAVSSCVMASLTLKKTAEFLWAEVGPHFNTTDLINQIPKTFWQLYSQSLVKGVAARES